MQFIWFGYFIPISNAVNNDFPPICRSRRLQMIFKTGVLSLFCNVQSTVFDCFSDHCMFHCFVVRSSHQRCFINTCQRLLLCCCRLLTDFYPMFSFYTPWKHVGFLLFSGNIDLKWVKMSFITDAGTNIRLLNVTHHIICMPWTKHPD